MCFTQRHIKRLLAYSTIAHIGLFTIGLAALSPLGIAGSALWLAGHAGIKGALFLLTGLLLTRYRSVDELTLFGRARDHRWIGGLFVLGSLALAGLPPFGAGLGKALLEEADKSVWAVVLTIAVSAVTGGAALRVALRVYFGLGVAPPDKSTVDEVTGRNEEPDASAPRGGRTPATMLAAVLVLLVAGARRVAGDRPRRRAGRSCLRRPAGLLGAGADRKHWRRNGFRAGHRLDHLGGVARSAVRRACRADGVRRAVRGAAAGVGAQGRRDRAASDGRAAPAAYRPYR
jgi:formate hydrogenlyase subunit 3/multisubunit Na+/H+ antiporter MnhD subunit